MNGPDETMPSSALAIDAARTPPMHPVPVPELSPEIGRKRVACGMCALLFGWLGVHKFIAGYSGTGVLMLVISLATCGVGAIAMWVIGAIEGIQYLRQSDAEFNAVYLVGKRRWF